MDKKREDSSTWGSHFLGRTVKIVVATAAVAGIGALIYGYGEGRKEFDVSLRGLEGLIAYSVDKEIHIIPANELPFEDPKIRRVQAVDYPKKILMADKETIFYTSEVFENTRGETDFFSDSIYRIDLKDGQSNLIFSPAHKSGSEERSTLFPRKDTLKIDDLGYDSASGQFYTKMNGIWYSMRRDGSDLRKIGNIPASLRTITSKDSKDRFTIYNPIFGSCFIKSGWFQQDLEEKSDNPDWFYDSPPKNVALNSRIFKN